MFFFFSSSLEPLFFQCSYRTYFFRSSYRSWKNILVLKNALDSPYSGTPRNYLVNWLFNQFKARLVATFIWYNFKRNLSK